MCACGVTAIQVPRSAGQVDAGGELAGCCGQVKPAELVRRAGVQFQLAWCHLAAPADLAAGAAVISRGGGERAAGPLGH